MKLRIWNNKRPHRGLFLFDIFLKLWYNKEKRFNEFKTKEDAEKVLNKLKNYARNKDYSGIEMGKAYFIHSKGIIYHSIFCAWNVEGMKSIGNWFKTKEEAEEALNKLKEIN